MTKILIAALAAVLLLLIFVVMWLAIVSRANNLDKELHEEDEHAADLPKAPPPKIDFRGMRLFND